MELQREQKKDGDRHIHSQIAVNAVTFSFDSSSDE